MKRVVVMGTTVAPCVVNKLGSVRKALKKGRTDEKMIAGLWGNKKTRRVTGLLFGCEAGVGVVVG